MPLTPHDPRTNASLTGCAAALVALDVESADGVRDLPATIRSDARTAELVLVLLDSDGGTTPAGSSV
jgi:hypothetical protein